MKYILIILIALILMNCTKNLPSQATNSNGGIVLTFDDKSVVQWKMADDSLSQYNWKATFCVSNLNKLSYEDWEILKSFQESGHEIAGHGYNHVNATDYSKQYGVLKYVSNEIIPMLTTFNQKGINISSFAYPYGSRSSIIDKELSAYFNILRGVSYGNQDQLSAKCIYNDGNLIYGLGIDDKYSHFFVNYYLDLLDYAKRNNKIVIFYAHTPIDKVEKSVQVSFSTLKIICEYCYLNDIEFLRLKDLIELE